jgi:site-specific DNA-methyltransferase (adenine-specific)
MTAYRDRVDGDGWTMLLGDCREILPTLTGIDAVVTDPPYGIGHRSHGQVFVGARPCANDECQSIAEDVIGRLIDSGMAVVCFYSPYVPILAGRWRSILVWNKGAHVGIGGDRETCWKRDFELIGVQNNGRLNGQRDSAVISHNAPSPPPSGHFCEKPTSLMRYLVDKVTQPTQTVLDLFAGSGTTGVACIETGRRFVGIEIDENYFKVACNRLRNATPCLFGKD